MSPQAKIRRDVLRLFDGPGTRLTPDEAASRLATHPRYHELASRDPRYFRSAVHASLIMNVGAGRLTIGDDHVFSVPIP